MERAWHLVAQTVLTAAVLAAALAAATRDESRIVEGLKVWTPLGLAAAFVLLAVLLIASLRDLRGLFEGVSKRQWIAAAAVAALAFGLAFGLAPRTHRIYYDENIYLHIGQTIAATGKAEMVNFGEMKSGRLVVEEGEYNKQPNAWPFLLSLVYRIAGPGEPVSFLVNNLVFAAGAFLMFLLGVLLFGEFRTGIYAAAAYAVIPQNILWHNTTAAEPAGTTAILLTVFLAYAAARTAKLKIVLLAFVSAAFASQFRMESLLVFPLIVLYLLIDGRQALRDPKAFYAVPLALVLLLPHILHLYFFLGHPWGSSDGGTFGLLHFGRNLATNGSFFIDNGDFPVLLTAAAAAAFLFRRKIVEKMQTGAWLLVFWGVFLFFYAGSYDYGADVRFALLALPPLALLAGAGLGDLDGWAARRLHRPRLAFAGPLVVAISFLMFAPAAGTVGEEAWAARADHRTAREMLPLVPKDALIFTHNPNMFLFWGKSSAQASILAGMEDGEIDRLRSRFPGGIYFHYNYWCNVSDPLQQSFCQGIMSRFNPVEVIRYGEREYSFALYKLKQGT